MRTWVLLASLALAGCGGAGTSVPTRGAVDAFNVERLFEVDGCVVFRFYDHMNAHYFTNCAGQTTSTVACGKGCYREERIGGRP